MPPKSKKEKKMYDKLRRERIKSDPELLRLDKMQRRDNYLKRKLEGRVLMISDMSVRSKRSKRQQWKTNSSAYQQRKKASKDSVDTPIAEMVPPTPAASRQSSSGRKRLQRDRSAVGRTNMKLREQVARLQREVKKQQKRYERRRWLHAIGTPGEVAMEDTTWNGDHPLFICAIKEEPCVSILSESGPSVTDVDCVIKEELDGDDVSEEVEDPLKTPIKEEPGDEPIQTGECTWDNEDMKSRSSAEDVETDVDDCVEAERASEMAESNPPSKKKGLAPPKCYKCKECKLSFSLAILLREHMMTHSEQPYKCDVCFSTFRRVKLLNRHKLIHRGEKPHKCDVCSASFAQSNRLKEHTLIHSGEKPYKCDTCSSTFVRAEHLRRHKMIHSGENPFKCDVCSSAFVRADFLRQHMMSHRGLKPYKCDVCSASFVTSTRLRQHILIHSGEKPFKCDICSATYVRAEHLRRHKMKHTGENFDVCL